jgi:sterol desaturase/sphingolipid hydroxylase (fatty acid hydroxylase superfamily)
MAFALAQLTQIAVFFLLGFVVESVSIADELNTARNVGFNVAWAALRTVLDVSFGIALAVWLTNRLSPYALFPLSRIAWVFPAALLAFFLRDFFYYWFHRLQHSSKWLWAEHELHHSDEHMNVTTAVRHHWLETPLEGLFIALPTALLFGQVRTSVLAVFITSTTGYFIHLNSRINLGVVFGSPVYHRLHHSKASEHIDKNFAAFFPLWDILFGTYYRPNGTCPETGLASGETIYSLPQAVVWPFLRWMK